jgi:transposase
LARCNLNVVAIEGPAIRRWSTDDKHPIVTSAEAEGTSVSELARRHEVARQQIYQWRSELRGKGLLPATPSRFVSVELTREQNILGPEAESVVPREPHVEIRLRNGRSLRVAADVPELSLIA